MTTDLFSEPDFDAMQVARLTADLKAEARHMGREEARFLVDAYYMMQKDRIAAGNQVSAGEKQDTPPMPLVVWLGNHLEAIEKRIKGLLDTYAQASPVGQWSLSVCGIGPVISAGLLAHIDIAQAPTVGHIWRFAGLDPSQRWLGKEGAKDRVQETLGRTTGSASDVDVAMVAGAVGRRPENLQHLLQIGGKAGEPMAMTVANLVKVGAKRPWNADLKTLCWKIGESFVKVSGNEADVYGHIYAERKTQEEERNAAGLFADQAAAALEAKSYRKDTTAKKCYEQGILPPGHIHARAKRYAVKLFLAHYHWVAYESEYGTQPPKPYVIEHLGHADLMGPPNWKK